MNTTTERASAWGTCHICYARRVTVLLATLVYRVRSIKGATRVLKYCSDSVECSAGAWERRHAAVS